ncbi:ABC transporter substrate-binding protein [Rhodoplanes serenus]|jgi:branched-chain amino acid transport system substrate-binding protein|uniref:ABC transporter substrate-binding protein n=1 Tax=Rhodoplanes serenus TaxID=200615 RepID=A0A327KCF0_9BRAD|nr:ABC transporter substrate-binding protein [Rhodoplanes serenus]MTW18726.1 ABC transporter substrate-binding protein [Rhodoplanes serenus]RAI36459.1 ABC transporter substrate-binding protein [Rhodoplanes serenus]
MITETRSGPDRRRLLAGGTALLASAFAGRLSAQGAEPIKVGYIVPLTGAYGADATIQVKGAEVAIARFNEEGGLAGRMAQLLVRDDKLNPGEASTRAQELIERENVALIAGCFGAPMLAVNAVTRQRGVLYNPVGASDAIVSASDWSATTFHEGPTPFMLAGALARYVVPTLGGSKRVALLVSDYVYGHEMVRGFVPVATSLGAEIVGEVRHPLGATDYSSYFPRLLAMKPDLLVVMSFGRDQQITFKQATEFGVKRQMRIAAPQLVHTARIIDGHSHYEGIVGGTGYYWGIENEIPSAKAFNDRFRRMHGGQNPSDYAAVGFASVMAPLIAMRNAGTTETKAVVAALKALRYDLYKGPQHYRACDQQAVQSILIITSKPPKEASVKDDIFKVLAVEQGSEDRLASCAALGHKT